MAAALCFCSSLPFLGQAGPGQSEAGKAAAAGPAKPDHVERARTILMDGLDAKDPMVRIQALYAIGLIGSDESIRQHVEESLDDTRVEVRVAAVEALADLKSTKSIPVLKKRLREDKTAEVTFAAAKALYTMHDETGRSALIDVFEGRGKAKSDVLHVKARHLVDNFHSFESASVFVLRQGIGYVPVPGLGEGIAAITSLVGDPGLSARASALLLLGRDRNKPSVRLLQAGLKDPDWSVRASAAQVIVQTRRTTLRDALVPLFDDKKDKVRYRAAAAYVRMGLDGLGGKAESVRPAE